MLHSIYDRRQNPIRHDFIGLFDQIVFKGSPPCDAQFGVDVDDEQPGDHGRQVFFVRGDGSVIFQAYPNRPMATPEVPTCRNKVSQEKVRGLVRLFLEKHFWDLPEKRFIFVYASQTEEELELQTGQVRTGTNLSDLAT